MGILFAREVGGVKVADVVPCAVKLLPTDKPLVCWVKVDQLYLNLCLNVVAAGVMVMVILPPMVTFFAENVGVVALGMVERVMVPLALALPEV